MMGPSRTGLISHLGSPQKGPDESLCAVPGIGDLGHPAASTEEQEGRGDAGTQGAGLRERQGPCLPAAGASRARVLWEHQPQPSHAGRVRTGFW